MDNFAYFCYVEELPELLADLNLLEGRLRAAGNVVGADRIVRAYATHKADLQAMGLAVSAKATEILRRHERESRVRPDTLGGGGARLGDHLECQPLSLFGGLTWGSVGVANESLLYHEVPWWWTNEEGYTGHVGRVLFGVFEPGSVPPDSNQFRTHPLFEPGGGGSGVIRNPIPARRFIEHAIPEISSLWHTSFEATKTVLIAEIIGAQAS